MYCLILPATLQVCPAAIMDYWMGMKGVMQNMCDQRRHTKQYEDGSQQQHSHGACKSRLCHSCGMAWHGMA
jgi:hypothetical protein